MLPAVKLAVVPLTSARIVVAAWKGTACDWLPVNPSPELNTGADIPSTSRASMNSSGSPAVVPTSKVMSVAPASAVDSKTPANSTAPPAGMIAIGS